MSNKITTLKTVVFLLCFVFLLNSCDTETEKMIPKAHTVEIKQMKFQPAELIIQKGDTVVWINNDIVAHDVTEEPGKAWTSSMMPVGGSWSLVVTQSADYYCSIHVVMKGKLIVQ
ncbi:MAG TPA: plastocyanin/azurin family copper-binding protein [Chitinophagaceae bacterium]